MDTTPIICMGCGEIHIAGNVRCPNCHRCPNCGRRIKDEARAHCPSCEHPTRPEQLETLKTNRDPQDPAYAFLIRMREEEIQQAIIRPRVRWILSYTFLFGGIMLPCLMLAMIVAGFVGVDAKITFFVAQTVALFLMIYGSKQISLGKWPIFLRPESESGPNEIRSNHR